MNKRFEASQALYQRALKVIPGGVYGHQRPEFLVPGHYPAFISSAKGCRIEDPDGNRYIDFMCSYGPMVVGYANPAVEEAVDKQRGLCDSGNLPAPNLVELAEKLVSITEGMDWAMFAKNGSDVCSWSVALARQASGRPLVAMVAGTYHGVHAWCNNAHAGFLEGERAATMSFQWNDLSSLEALFEDHPDQIAAVIVTPLKHEDHGESVMPGPGFIAGLRKLCSRHGSVMIVDDVRAGFRLHMGGSTQCWGVSPDLLLYSKAMANGYAVSAILGTEALREAARRVFVTGTFFTQAVPIAAALATIEQLQSSDGIKHMFTLGERFSSGLLARAEKAGYRATVSGPPALPLMTFDEDRGSFQLSRRFGAAWAARGVFINPVHNWFISTAHSEADIDEALFLAEGAFEELRKGPPLT